MKRQILILLSIMFVATGSASGQARGTAVKPVISHNLQNRFSLEIDGITVAGVQKIDGLQEALGKAEAKQKSGGGSATPGRITITKHWSNTPEWANWRKKVLDGKTDRRSVSIIFHDDAGVETFRMNFYNCWPVKHELPSANAKNSGHASEQIVLEHEDVKLK